MQLSHRVWNERTIKCLDDSMFGAWDNKVARAIKGGAAYSILCTLHPGDYKEYKTDENNKIDFLCCVARDCLTMQPLVHVEGFEAGIRPMWQVDERFASTIQWVRGNDKMWTLGFGTRPKEDDPSGKVVVVSLWAYFMILLDPVMPESYN